MRFLKALSGGLFVQTEGFHLGNGQTALAKIVHLAKIHLRRAIPCAAALEQVPCLFQGYGSTFPFKYMSEIVARRWPHAALYQTRAFFFDTATPFS